MRTCGTPKVLSPNVSRDTHTAYQSSTDMTRYNTSRDSHVSDAFQLGLAREVKGHVDDVTPRNEANSVSVVVFVHIVDGFKQENVQIHQCVETCETALNVGTPACGHPCESRLTFTVSDSGHIQI